MGRRNPGSNVEWVGLIVRTDDGQVHAVEMDGRAGRVTVDLAIDNGTRGMYISAVIQGRGAYWREGENLGPRAQTWPEALGGTRQIAIEAGDGDGKRG
jgi:hypothetical protein